MLWILLVITAVTPMRCASRVIDLFSLEFNLPIKSPSWYTGRLWLMRLGYYKLNREKEKAGDWIWIVDHSIQIGAEKCLIILGVRSKNLSENKVLTFQDVEPIDLVPIKKSNGEVVYEQLEAATKKTGIPREIIADEGPDLKSGINKFIENHTETCRIYDIKHKTASLLKQELGKDVQWQNFVSQCAQTKVQVQQTSLGFLAPPNQRTKARYMNIEELVVWAQRVLNFIDTEQKIPSGKFDQEKIKEKLQWIQVFREKICDWGNMMSVIGVVESFVRHNGLTKNTSKQLEIELNKLTLAEQSTKIKNNLLHFVECESQKAKGNERLLGSSEIIESLFGKQKKLEQEQSKNGFTGLILSIGSFVSETNEDVIINAMNTVKTKDVLKWANETIGNTVQSLKKMFLIDPKKLEQKQNQLALST